MTDLHNTADAVAARPAYWWENLTLSHNQCVTFQIGQLGVMLSSHQKEWTLAWQYDRDIENPDGHFQVSYGPAPQNYLAAQKIQRIARAHPDSEMRIEPRLADRNIVARPTYPMTVAAGDSIDFYLSTPLWFTFKHQKRDDLYFDKPVIFLSDTWFGPNNLIGELCYATKTQCRLYLDELPKRQTRAITPVKIINQLNKPFSIERINVPVPYLSIQQANDGTLWTEQVLMTCSHDKNNPTSVTLARDRFALAGTTHLIAKARQTYAKDSLKSMLAVILE